MPGVDLDLDLPSLSDPLSTIVSKLVTAVSTIEDDLADRVTAGELDLDTTVSLNGNPLTNVGGVRLLGGESTVVGTLYMDEELNIVTTAGVVQLTSNGAINASSIGGIVGDYGGANPAAVTYDDASGEFRFTEAPGTYADIVCDDIKLIGAGGSLRLAVDATLSGAQFLNFKSFPSSGVGLLVYQASDSTLIDGSAAAGAISLPVVLTVDEIRYTDAITVGIPAAYAQSGGPTWGANTMIWTVSTSTARVSYPVTIPVGCRLVSWKVYVTKTSASGTIGAELYRVDSASGARTKIGATQSNGANAPGDIPLGQSPINDDVSAGNTYTIQVFGGGTTGDFFNDAEVTYSRP